MEVLLYLFTVTSPNIDFETTFFGQLKKPCHALGFWDFAFCVARRGKTPVQNSLQHYLSTKPISNL